MKSDILVKKSLKFAKTIFLHFLPPDSFTITSVPLQAVWDFPHPKVRTKGEKQKWPSPQTWQETFWGKTRGANLTSASSNEQNLDMKDGQWGKMNTLRGLMRKGLQKARTFPAPHRRARSTRTSARRATFSIQNERAADQQTLQFWQWNLPNTSPFFSLHPRQQPSFRYCPSPVVSTFPAIPSSLGPSSFPEHPSSHFPQTCFIPCVICMLVHYPKCLPVLETGQAKAAGGTPSQSPT